MVKQEESRDVLRAGVAMQTSADPWAPTTEGPSKPVRRRLLGDSSCVHTAAGSVATSEDSSRIWLQDDEQHAAIQHSSTPCSDACFCVAGRWDGLADQPRLVWVLASRSRFAGWSNQRVLPAASRPLVS